MYIKRLELENIRSYEHLDMTFPKGIILLSGDIGSGKTTILLALEFGLFGISKKHYTASHLLRHNKTEGKVRVTCIIKDSEYIFTRTLQRQKQSIVQGKCSVSINNQQEDMTATQLRAFIIELLGYPPNQAELLYRYTVFTAQEVMKHIIDEVPETRLSLLRTLFCIEKYKTIKENTQLSIKELKQKEAFMLGQCAHIHEVEQQLQKQKQEATSLAQQQQNISTHTHYLRSVIDMMQQDVEEQQQQLKQKQLVEQHIQTAQQQKQELLKKQQAVIANIQQLQDTIQHIHIKDVVYDNQKHVALQQRYETILSEYHRQTLHIQTTQQKRQHLQQKIHELQAILTQPSNQEMLQNKKAAYLKKQEHIEQQRQQLPKLKEELHRLQEQKAKHTHVSELKPGVCTTCLQPITDAYAQSLNNRIAQSKKTVQDIQVNIEQITKQIQHIEQLDSTAMQVAIATIEKDIEQEKKKEQQQQEATKTIQTLQQELQALPAQEQNIYAEQKKEIEATLQQYKQQQQEYTEQQQKQEQKKRIEIQIATHKQHNEVYNQDIQHISQQIHNLEQHPIEVCDNVVTLYKQLQEKCTQQEQQVALVQQKQTFIQQQIQDIEQRKKHMQTYKQKAQQIHKDYTWLRQHFIPLMDTMESHVLQTIYHECNTYFMQWFAILMDNDQLHAQLGHDFSPLIQQNGYDIAISALSGGERTSVALAYRLALHKVVHNVVGHIATKSLIMLDEPTDGFSSEQLDRMHSILQQLFCEQIIIVSHEQKLASFVDHTIYINKQYTKSSIQA